MIKNVYVIYDSKAEVYRNPIHFDTHGIALRAFTDLIQKEGNEFNAHPEDYTMFFIATYDEKNGTYINEKTHISMAKAIELMPKTAPSLAESFKNVKEPAVTPKQPVAKK